MLEAYACKMQETATMLKKELEGSGGPKSSTRKGKIDPKKVAHVLAKVQKNRTKKPRG